MKMTRNRSKTKASMWKAYKKWWSHGWKPTVGCCTLPVTVVVVTFCKAEKMNHVQTALVILSVLSVSTVLGSRYRRSPQYIPLYTVNNQLHNSIAALTYDLHNRIASAVNYAAANAIGNSAYAFASNNNVVGYHYPVDGNTIVQTFGAPGQQGIFISSISGGGSRPSPTPSRPLTTSSIRPFSTSIRPASSVRPVTTSFRPTSTTPIRPVSTPGRPIALASVGLRPGGGISASAAAVSTSG